jgi:hypothetical protein
MGIAFSPGAEIAHRPSGFLVQDFATPQSAEKHGGISHGVTHACIGVIGRFFLGRKVEAAWLF